MAAYCQPTQAYDVITSGTGIGPMLGQSILLETGPIERFPSMNDYASYARCVPSQKISNSKKKGEGNRKNGNKYLGYAFMETAHYAAITITIWKVPQSGANRRLMKTPDADPSGPDWIPTILWGSCDTRGGMTSHQEQHARP